MAALMAAGWGNYARFAGAAQYGELGKRAKAGLNGRGGCGKMRDKLERK